MQSWQRAASIEFAQSVKLLIKCSPAVKHWDYLERYQPRKFCSKIELEVTISWRLRRMRIHLKTFVYYSMGLLFGTILAYLIRYSLVPMVVTEERYDYPVPEQSRKRFKMNQDKFRENYGTVMEMDDMKMHHGETESNIITKSCLHYFGSLGVFIALYFQLCINICLYVSISIGLHNLRIFPKWDDTYLRVNLIHCFCCMTTIFITVAYTMTSSNGNIFRVTGPLCEEFTGNRWIFLTKASDAELWRFLWSAPEKILEWTIWDTIAPIITSLQWEASKTVS